jgi:nucleotide-binding universal stress UspA family protein
VVNSRDLSSFERYLAIQDPASFQKFIDDIYASRDTNLRELLEMAQDQGVEGQKMIKTGVPYQELLSTIENEKPDILIMGTKGRNNLADTIIGSCAQKMYRRCPIPLLSIRPTKN